MLISVKQSIQHDMLFHPNMRQISWDSCHSLWIFRLQSYKYILSLSLFVVHDSKVTLIRRYILRIIGNANNETHGCIWHAAPMSKLKEESEHHNEHRQMFSHHNKFIGAFMAWVRHPSILFTLILRRCNAFIISVIVAIRRSIIFAEHFLWHFITVGKISIHA